MNPTTSVRPYQLSSAVYDALYQNAPYDKNAAVVADLVQQLRGRPGGKMLEVACGTGLYAGPFASHGFDVIGLDLSPEQLQIARDKFPKMQLIQADMSNFTSAPEFDVVVCMFSSIGCVETCQRLRGAVDAMSAALKPGGVLVIEPWVFKGEITGRQSVIEAPMPNGGTVRRVNSVTVDGAVSYVHMDYTVTDQDGEVDRFDETMALGLFTKHEYSGAMLAAGINNITFYGTGLGADGSLFRRGLFVGKKAHAQESSRIRSYG